MRRMREEIEHGMSREKVTSADVALRAGVSRSAVSRVFTPGASASAKTAEKVRKAAAELGYRPNVLARAMVSGKSRIIGLVVAYLENQFYPDSLEKFSKALQAQGYHVLVMMASEKAGNIDKAVQRLLDYQVDGIIATSVALTSDMAAQCQRLGVPLVLFNRAIDSPDVSAVTSDNWAGGRKVAEFLLAGGHRKIAHIAGWDGASTQRDREAGFVHALRAAGHDLHARVAGNYLRADARAATLKLFETDPPDAIFVGNDHMAIAVLDTLRQDLGLRVPEDVSIVGYDDIPLASWPTYDLTTVRQRTNVMVAETVALMLDQIDTPSRAPEVRRIESPLIIRGSARRPGSASEDT